MLQFQFTLLSNHIRRGVGGLGNDDFEYAGGCRGQGLGKSDKCMLPFMLAEAIPV